MTTGRWSLSTVVYLEPPAVVGIYVAAPALPLHPELHGYLSVLAEVGCEHHGGAPASGRASQRRAQLESGSLTLRFRLHSGVVFFGGLPDLIWIGEGGEAGHDRLAGTAQDDDTRIAEQVQVVACW